MHYDQRNRKSLTRAIEEQVYSLCQSSVRPRIRALQSIKVGPRIPREQFWRILDRWPIVRKSTFLWTINNTYLMQYDQRN
jgi:hypothetical protein